MLQQVDQAILIDQRTGLQELAQLMNLNALVHFVEPCNGLGEGFGARSFNSGFEIGAGLHVDDEFARQFVVDGIKPQGRLPLRCGILLGRARSHDFTIQLGTSPRKRAATMVLPGLYCTATTEASISSEPSELRRRRTSANSSGVLQAKRTSREVPNSMTVLSLKSAATESSAPRI